MDKKEFFRAVLIKMGYPVTDNAINFLLSWAAYEGRAAGKFHGFNPLNTTYNNIKNDPKQTNFNTNAGYPVKSYSTFQSGVDSTAATLKLRYYRTLAEQLKTGRFIEALKADKDTAATVAKELRTWGTHTFANTLAKKPVKPAPKKDNTAKIVIGIILVLGLVAYFAFPTVKYTA